MKLSIVIPTLNEADCVGETIDAARRGAVLGGSPEFVVSDCGSGDDTVQRARAAGAAVADEAPFPASRAAALNRGARRATGDVLLFLDADTLLPAGYDAAVFEALRHEGVVGVAFEFGFDRSGFVLGAITLVNRMRYRVSHRYHGDQAVFARAETFRRAGGYPEIPILEAYEFSARLRREGRLHLIRLPVRTSARRFVEGGVLRVAAQDFRIWLRHGPLRRRSATAAVRYQAYNRSRSHRAPG